jgi:hypothetical protein
MTGEKAKEEMTPIQLQAVKAMEACGYLLGQVSNKIDHLWFDKPTGTVYFGHSWIVIDLRNGNNNAILRGSTTSGNPTAYPMNEKEMRAALGVIDAFKLQ